VGGVSETKLETKRNHMLLFHEYIQIVSGSSSNNNNLKDKSRVERGVMNE